jgi:hypothetical protein
VSEQLSDLLLLVGGVLACMLAFVCAGLVVTGDVRRRASARAHVRIVEQAIEARAGSMPADLATSLRRQAERLARDELACGCAPMEYGVPCALCHGCCLCHSGTTRIPGIWAPKPPRTCQRCGLAGDCRTIGEGFQRRMDCTVRHEAEERRAAGDVAATSALQSGPAGGQVLCSAVPVAARGAA